jgi:hypothetical protein
MLTTALNTLVLLRLIGLRLAHEAGWDSFGPLLVMLAIIGVLIGLLSWAGQRELPPSRRNQPAPYRLRARQNELTPR